MKSRALGRAGICARLAVLVTFQWSCGKEKVFACDTTAGTAEASSELQPSALVDGFRVPQFQLTRDLEAGTFLLVLPSSTEVLTCAVFVANPRFDRSARIANAVEVLARYQIFYVDQGTSTLSFGLTSFEHPTADTFRSCGEPPERYRVEGLSLGCWAMDDTAIVAATRLLELALSELPQTQAPVGSCLVENLADTAGRLCAVDAQFGVCREGVCQAGASDASAPAGTPLHECTAATGGEACVLNAPMDLGRCRSGLCVPEPGADVPADQLVIDCSDMNTGASKVRDGFSCLQRELGTFGTCFGGRCRQRCDPASHDCTSPLGEFRGTLAVETTCGALPTANVSVCVQPGELP